MQVPSDLIYSSDHEWIRRDGRTVRIGITDYAQDALGDVVFVQVPSVGATVSKGQSFSEVESTKSVSDIYAPVGGTVAATNSDIEADPSLVNSDPYGAGWICEITMSNPDEANQLMSAAEYQQLTAG